METLPLEEVPPLSGPNAYQHAALSTAQYLTHDKPTEILYQGLQDEVIELLEQAHGDAYWTSDVTPEEAEISIDDWRSELGDLLWYGSQILYVRGEPLSEYITSDEWEEPQRDDATLRDVVSDTGWLSRLEASAGYNFKASPVVCLALLTFQLSDLIHGHTDSNNEAVKIALQDLIAGIIATAGARGLSLADIAIHNLQKLANRERKPHTITHVEENLPSLLKQKRLLWVMSMSFPESNPK